MYLNFFNLQKEPFHITPDPEFLFLSPSHKEALASIIYGIRQRKGFLSVVGEVGTGKTTIVRSYLSQIDRNKTRVAYIFHPNTTFMEVLKAICREMDFDVPTENEYEMVNELHQLLIDMYMQGQSLVLIIDEAQNMPMKTLENLRMLSNLETNTDKLLQIVLIGQPELQEMLELPDLRQLKQRIAVRTTIKHLTQQESVEYIKHRLWKAAPGVVDNDILSEEAMQLIARNAEGAPRVLNILCDNVLISAMGRQEKPISLNTAREVVDEYFGVFKPKSSWKSWFGFGGMKTVKSE